MIQIIKTENPDVVIERKTINREINIKELEDSISELQGALDDIVDIEILDIYPEEVKNLIIERNEENRRDIEIELSLLNEELNKYVNNL